MDFKPDLLRFKFENFAPCMPLLEKFPLEGSIESNRLCSECLTDCNGIKWRLSLFAYHEDFEEKDWIGCELENQSEKSLDAVCEVSIKNTMGESISIGGEMLGLGSLGVEAWDYKIIQSSTILDANNKILKDGALYVEAFIQSRNFYVKPAILPHIKAHQDRMLELLRDTENADISIEVDGQIFHLHSLILEHNAPILAEYCKRSDNIIDNMDDEIFRVILGYVYTGCFPNFSAEFDRYQKLDLIDAANRFELTELKDGVEHDIVHMRQVDKFDAANCIVFADAQSCPLLKEYAISVFLLFAEDILNSDDSKTLRESGELMSEIWAKMKGENLRKRKSEEDVPEETMRQRTE